MLEDIDTKKIQASNMVSSSQKKRNSLLVTNMMILKLNHCSKCFQKRCVYVKSYDGETKWMHFLIKDAAL